MSLDIFQVDHLLNTECLGDIQVNEKLLFSAASSELLCVYKPELIEQTTHSQLDHGYLQS